MRSTVGDYVLVHVGYALHKVSPEEAERTLQLMAEAGILGGAEEMTGGAA
jgi:hydrogenase expression/formation protein HypC